MYYNKGKSQRTKHLNEVKELERQKVALKVVAFTISRMKMTED